MMSFKSAWPVLALLGACAAGPALATASDAKLLAQAKVNEQQATQTVKQHFPNSKIVKGELEQESKLVWSFDLAQSGKPGVTEVQVDAITGKIASVKHESAAQEAAESKTEMPGK